MLECSLGSYGAEGTPMWSSYVQEINILVPKRKSGKNFPENRQGMLVSQ